MTTVADPAQHSRRDDHGFYTWDGEKLPSVTTILGIAPGQHLMAWYAKQAALKAASHLAQAGVVPIDSLDPVLQEFVANQTAREITKVEAVKEILDYGTVMREAERYRDHKARIGSVVHHAVYERALGMDAHQFAQDMHMYLCGVTERLDLWRESHGAEFRPTDAMIESVALAAATYVRSAFDWIETANPEWDLIGQEAAVFRPCDPSDPELGDVGYAGTVDCVFRVRRESYGHEWLWGDAAEVTLMGDFKTSNVLAVKSVQMQVEAYANASFIGLIHSGQTFEVPDVTHIGALHIGPHAADAKLRDEFGEIASKAHITGARFTTWKRNRETWLAFCGLCRYYRWLQDVPKPERPTKQPKPPARDKSAPRSCPF